MGLYVANAGLDDVSVPVTLGPAVEALRANCSQGCVLVVSTSYRVIIPQTWLSSPLLLPQIDNQALATDAPALIVSDHSRFAALHLRPRANLPPASQPYLPTSPTSPLKPTPLPNSSFTLTSPTTPADTLDKIQSGVALSLGDFDDHLEDLTVDWLRNAKVTM